MSNYIAPLIKHVRTMAKPGTVTVVTVLHDDWCSLLTGPGPCNCQPDLEIPLNRRQRRARRAKGGAT